ncbi:MAG: DUF542 domain-containing protein, partial [Saprospiraceae bacterium]|nr:DUF542 domain-containing protein [Saprospiraceae bacterium]
MTAKRKFFKKFGIDFCCGGKNTVEFVCKKHGVNRAKLEAELAAVSGINNQATHDFNSWELPFLIDYIINVHHKYVTSKVDLIHQYARKVARVHGHAAAETVEIADLFSA